MALDPRIIGSIVNGVTSLSTAFVGFGASVYAVDNAPMPVADEYNYQIIVPPTKDTGIDLGTGVLVVFIIAMVFFLSYIVYKKL